MFLQKPFSRKKNNRNFIDGNNRNFIDGNRTNRRDYKLTFMVHAMSYKDSLAEIISHNSSATNMLQICPFYLLINLNNSFFYLLINLNKCFLNLFINANSSSLGATPMFRWFLILLWWLHQLKVMI